MKNYDLKPTYKNLLKTYDEDTIGRTEDVLRFVDILNSLEGGCSIALDGNWGSGKTFFVKQAKMVLDAHNRFVDSEAAANRDQIIDIRNQYYGDTITELQPQVCVYYDAWSNDNDDDPLLSIVYTILNSVESDYSFKDRSYVKTAANILEMFSGKDWNKLIDGLKGEDPLSSLKKSKSVDKLIGDFLETLLPERGNRLIIFVDELDRCKPGYAVRLLERVKHYFENEQITFVFAVNINELQHVINGYYGNNFDGSRYLDRFFDLRITLPSPNMEKYFESLSFCDSNYKYDIVCSAVIRAYRFELREIAKYVRLIKIAAYKPMHNDRYRFGFPEERAIEFGIIFFVPIIVGLKIIDINKYYDFIDGKDSQPMMEVANELPVQFFNVLLSNNETYDVREGCKVVALKDKLEEVYNAFFATKYDANKYRIDIGKMRFNAGSKAEILRITGLLSRYTDMQY